jgi:hypothetical protein
MEKVPINLEVALGSRKTKLPKFRCLDGFCHIPIKENTEVEDGVKTLEPIIDQKESEPSL